MKTRLVYPLLVLLTAVLYCYSGCRKKDLDVQPSERGYPKGVFREGSSLRISKAELSRAIAQKTGMARLATPFSIDLKKLEYIDSSSWIAIRVPINNSDNHFFYARKTDAAPEKLLLYGVIMTPSEGATDSLFSGNLEFIDFNEYTTFVRRYDSSTITGQSATLQLPDSATMIRWRQYDAEWLSKSRSYTSAVCRLIGRGKVSPNNELNCDECFPEPSNSNGYTYNPPIIIDDEDFIDPDWYDFQWPTGGGGGGGANP